MKIRTIAIGTVIWTLPFGLWAAKVQYDVHFQGIDNPIVLEAVRTNSDLVFLKDRPPASINGLQYRIQSDIPNLLQALKAYAYYDAHITYEMIPNDDHFMVELQFHLGSPFRLASYEVYHGNCLDPSPLPGCKTASAEDVGLHIGQIADSMSIINAEMTALVQLSRCGYPLAIIDKRRIIVDMANESVDAAVCIQEGPLAKFGPITFFGLKDVKPRFIERKILWKEGQQFNIDLVDETQNRLLKSDLFSSVLISHAEEIDDSGELSMKVRLTEAKHRSISLGLYYATVDGPGGNISWIHRNLRGLGEYLKIEMSASKRFIGGSLNYRKPDFYRVDQTLSIWGEAGREDILAYLAFTYLESNRIERQLNPKTNVSIGLLGEYINVHESVNNGHFFILGLPFFARYTTADAPLDPTEGLLISYAATPYQSLNESSIHYFKQVWINNFYIPLMENKKVVLALHAEIGSIAGAKQREIPLPLLFLGGSEDDLRGYGYKTVSPLGHKKGKHDNDSPKGGRSAIFTTVEFRFRASQSIGIVPFVDFGTVSSKQCPQVQTKWFRSVGCGFRYFTFFGPLRLDVGFPLDRRKKLDTWGKVYASIGQSF